MCALNSESFLNDPWIPVQQGPGRPLRGPAALLPVADRGDRDTDDGELHRKAILFRFGVDYVRPLTRPTRALRRRVATVLVSGGRLQLRMPDRPLRPIFELLRLSPSKPQAYRKPLCLWGR
jgi:hypothetical protein